MHHAALGPLEPAHVLGLAIARDHADVAGLGGIPAPVHLALFQALRTRHIAAKRQQHMPMRDRHVVDQADVGLLEAHLMADVAVLVGGVQIDIVGGQALGLVANGDHVAGQRIDLGMGGEGLALPLAVEVPGALGGQGVRVELVGQPVFLQREQPAGMGEGRGVGDRAQIRVQQVAHARVVGVRVAVIAIELPAGRLLRLQAMGTHPAAVEVDLAALEAEAAGVAIGIQRRVIREQGGVIPVTADAVKGAVEVRGDLAEDFTVVDIRFKTGRGAKSAPRGLVKQVCHGQFPPSSRFETL